jgi:hypothetical protein
MTLDEQYYTQLNTIAAAIQNAPQLAEYLEEEDDEQYNNLRLLYEPYLSELHHLVAAEQPLQLPTFEKTLLDPIFEGLYLPRILGYAVLRGEINDQYRYVRPNDHFKEILIAICMSPHFDQLRKRIGQTISVAFALSSDIWITNLLGIVENKRIRTFLQSQKNDRFRDLKDRQELYARYANQFRNELYFSAEFPTALGEMKANFSALRQFLLKRFEVGGDNSSLKDKIKGFLENPQFTGTDEYVQMLAIYGNFMDLDPADALAFQTHFEKQRRSFPEFDVKFLRFLSTMHQAPGIDAVSDARMSASIDKKWKDKISAFYRIADTVHEHGYADADAIDAVREFTNSHEGLAVESECLRQLVLRYLLQDINGLQINEYGNYFEITKIFTQYIKIFNNSKFEQDIEKASMAYIRKLLAIFTDKRGKDYQDVKKFVSTQFVDLGFLSDKEAVEIFKSRRKKREDA